MKIVDEARGGEAHKKIGTTGLATAFDLSGPSDFCHQFQILNLTCPIILSSMPQEHPAREMSSSAETPKKSPKEDLFMEAVLQNLFVVDVTSSY